MLLDDPDRIPDTAYLPPLLMVVLVLQMVLVIELDPERILRDRERTLRLTDLLNKGGLLRVTTERGTDFSCEMVKGTDAIYPVMAIIPRAPLYAPSGWAFRKVLRRGSTS